MTEGLREGVRGEMEGGGGNSVRPEGPWKSNATERTRESDRMHERRDTTAEQLREKDKRAVKCQGYLIH